jgi:hypothetical protein
MRIQDTASGSWPLAGQLSETSILCRCNSFLCASGRLQNPQTGITRISIENFKGISAPVTIPRTSELEIMDREYRRLVEPGLFKIMVGSSSTDIRLEGDFNVIPGSIRN